MRWIICCITLMCMAAVPESGIDLNRTPPPTTQPAEGYSIPYKITDSNHIMVRVKINGKGPFNFIMDTGAPAMFVRVPVAQKLGLKNKDGGISSIDTLEIEGGATLKKVQCVVETPYQIEGMNAMGASGVELDGLMGYSILARFRLQIDLSKDHMIWTPVNYIPPALPSLRGPRPDAASAQNPEDKREANLESMGTVMKILGPMVKPKEIPSKFRGFVGVELSAEGDKVTVARVLGGSPAEKAGIEAGDVLESLNGNPIHTVTAAQSAMSKTFIGQTAKFVLDREDAVLNLNVLCTGGL